ncbi:PDDEXK nuclease domain-containing protein [Segatella copri]|uniref:PDDEXK nuclease domain-containing protein n=1 Tax=Segatella copri TaxID=165179 RepID=UPI00294B7B1B|nr:PDDEXK nuclease domain-containing protein [Segatella copri]
MKKNEIPVAQNNDFDGLVAHIQQTQDVLQNNARLVINRHVTAKAWLTGYYIVEYEQKGADRAKYGEQLLKKLAEKLKDKKTFSYRTLRLYRQFYLVYNRLGLPIKKYLCGNLSIGQSVIAKLKSSQNEGLIIWQSVIAKSSDVVGNEVWVDPQELFDKLSFTHLAAILPISDPLERAFYETMAIRGTWSVRELQRQIDSNYYFRSGWSQKPEALAKLVEGKAETDTLALDIKSPFTFEFLGLQAKDVVEESDLETALITHLQDFILELGMGFCFEERQKKMLIDDRYFKADLVFYHRILKRHVIIELKANRLNYADAAQLHMYLAYYRKNIMQPDDNPPIGILLCSEVGQEMAEYSLLDLDESVFISKYQLNVPSKERMTEFLRKENEGIYNKV